LLACQKALFLTWADVLLCVVIFLVAELILSRFLYKLRVRDRPY
jgi:CDP-2,3-bis-(O-geranylgeranyl)-sn-glycerol synthase